MQIINYIFLLGMKLETSNFKKRKINKQTKIEV